MRALEGDRKSLPSLLMVSRDLAKVLNDRHSDATQTQDYLDQLASLTSANCQAGQPERTRITLRGDNPYRQSAARV